MLFYLTDSLIVDSLDPVYTDVYNTIDNIIKASEERRHLVMGDYAVLEWFSRLYDDKNPRKGVLLRMIHNFSTDVIPPDLTEYVKVVKGDNEEIEEDGKMVYLINFQRFKMSSSLETSRIIGEDENDAKLYAQINRWFLAAKSLPYDVNLRFEGGGGENTDRKVNSHKELLNIFVCIVDTDQKYRAGAKGKTYNKCNSIVYNRPLERFYPIEAQEVENIIPKSVLDELPWTNGNRGAKEKYDAIWNALKDDEDGWKYIDLKSGIRKTDKNEADAQHVAFMKKIYDCLPSQHKSFEEKFNKATPCEIMVGLSKDILRNSIGILENKSNIQLLNISDFLPFQEREWNQIGQILLDVGICANGEATNY